VFRVVALHPLPEEVILLRPGLHQVAAAPEAAPAPLQAAQAEAADQRESKNLGRK